MAFVILGIIFLLHGSQAIIGQPSVEEESDIVDKRKEKTKQDRLELSLDESDPGEDLNDVEDDKDEVTNIRIAIDWKRRHFFVACLDLLDEVGYQQLPNALAAELVVDPNRQDVGDPPVVELAEHRRQNALVLHRAPQGVTGPKKRCG